MSEVQQAADPSVRADSNNSAAHAPAGSATSLLSLFGNEGPILIPQADHELVEVPYGFNLLPFGPACLNVELPLDLRDQVEARIVIVDLKIEQQMIPVSDGVWVTSAILGENHSNVGTHRHR
ncbi:MAG: hypothetical protein ABL961_17080 [Vicinamibacterales bacterium]